MAPRLFDPLRLDVAAFAAEGAVLAGRWPLRSLARLVETAAPEASPTDADEVAWRVQGQAVAVSAGGTETWLRLDAEASIAMTCQRCLAPVAMRLQVDRRILFVPGGEDAAAEADAEREEDVLPLTRALDLRALVEDELLLAEPIVPVHELCPEPLPYAGEAAEAPAPKPFATLAALKARGGAN